MPDHDYEVNENVSSFNDVAAYGVWPAAAALVQYIPTYTLLHNINIRTFNKISSNYRSCRGAQPADIYRALF